MLILNTDPRRVAVEKKTARCSPTSLTRRYACMPRAEREPDRRAARTAPDPRSRRGARSPSRELHEGRALWYASGHSEEVDPLTPGELRSILETARKIEPDFAVLLQVAAQAGLRPGEVSGLRRSDLDWASGRLHARRSYSRGRIGPTKTRSVRVLKKGQVRYRKPHALRHSFASILLSRNAPLIYVTKAGGWRSATTRLQTYAKWVEQAEESASSVVSHQSEKR